MRFRGKVVFITGGAVGFGRAAARAFAAQGAALVIADIDDARAEETAAALRNFDATAIAVHCDVADESQVEAAMGMAIGHLGGIDVLLNNAALHLIKYNQPFSVLARDDLRALLNVNVVGIVNCTLACRDSMQERGGGAVVNISSTASHFSTTPYGVSKLAVRGLTVALATELADARIRVNAIAPGLMATENAIADVPEDIVDELVRNRQLVHRLCTMDDVVSTALFLCSEEASFITGETIRVSGGYPLSL
jgi:3-oxoacyl-[acyl-carrier protein] reductase